MPRRPFPSILPALAALAACAAPADAPPGGAVVASAETVLDPAADPDCRASLRRLLDAAARGPVRFAGPVPAAVVVSDPAAVEADLPLPVVADAASSAAPCLIVVGAPETLAATPVGTATVTRSGRSARERNPEYDLAKRRLRQAERRTDDRPKIIRTGDPLVDLIGAVAGGLIGAFVRSEWRQEEDEALADLAATPTSRERPVEPAAAAVARAAVFPVRLDDRARGATFAARLRVVERRETTAAAVSGAHLDRWSERPPRVRLSALIAGLLDAGAGAADPRASPSSAPSACAAPDAVRVLAGGGREVRGAYVAPYLVEAPADALGRSDVVEVLPADGGRVFGLVVERDPAGGRAVIQVPRRRPAAAGGCRVADGS